MNKKFGRHIGRRQEFTPLPGVQLSMDASRIWGGTPVGAAPNLATSLVPGVVQAAYLDPPVGGLANGDIVWSNPWFNADDTLLAATATVLSGFLPGHYEILLYGQGWTYTSTLEGAADITIHRQGNILQGPGGGPGLVVKLAGAAISNRCEVRFSLYAPAPWAMTWTLGSILSDAQVRLMGVAVVPVHLLDEGAGAS